MSQNEIVQVLLFGNKGFTKGMNFRIITSSIRFIKGSKDFMNHFSLFWRETFFTYFHGNKNLKYFSPSVSVFYVTHLL